MTVLGELNDLATTYTQTSDDFGRNEGITQFSVEPIACLAQEMSAAESREYNATGKQTTYRIFFLADPSIKSDYYLNVVSASLGKTFWVRVLTDEVDGRPDGTLKIFSVVAEELEAAGVPNVV